MPAYRLFGLSIRSSLDLPELAPADRDRADVEIVAGLLPPALANPASASETLDVAAGKALLRLGGIRYQVEGGRRITFDAPPGTPPEDIRLWLYGTVMAALLHQRGLLPLHANVVALADGGAAAFMGQSGDGKSTLAAWFAQQGRVVLSDDLCAVEFDAAGRPQVHPGIPRIKLWSESLLQFGQPAETLERIASHVDKYALPLGPQGAPLSGPLPLTRCYLLDQARGGQEPLISRLRGMEAAGAVLDNAFRWQLGQRLERGRSQFDQCMAVAAHAAVFRLARRKSFERFFAEAGVIEAHLDTELQVAER